MLEEPEYRRAVHLVEELAPAVEGDTDLLSPEEATEKAAEAARYAFSGHHPVLLCKVLRAIEVPEPVVYESVMHACSTPEDRAYIWAELFLPDDVRDTISGEGGA